MLCSGSDLNPNVCVFNWGWTVHLQLSDIDECKAGQECGPNTHCHNTNGSFYCTCQRDYIQTSGTKHFHPESSVRCKGRYENGRAHQPTHTHPRTCILLHLLFSSFPVTHAHTQQRAGYIFFFIGESIVQKIRLTVKIINWYFKVWWSQRGPSDVSVQILYNLLYVSVTCFKLVKYREWMQQSKRCRG